MATVSTDGRPANRTLVFRGFLNFGLLVVDPQAVDFLEINGHPQNRWQFHRDDHGRWSGVEVNP